MAKRLLISFIFYIVSTSFLSAQSTTYENQVVDTITFNFINQADQSIDTSSLKSRLTTKEGRSFSQVEFDGDLKMLAKEYDRIDPLLEAKNGKTYITLNVWAKPKICAICWKGNKGIKTSYLQSELEITEGSIYDRQAFNHAFNQLKTYYISQGYFEAELNYCVVPQPNCNEVNIEICINEGRAGRIRQICFCNFTKEEEAKISQDMHTKKYNLFLSWLSGEGTYNEEMIQEDQLMIINYLQNLGYADAKVKITICEVPQNNRIDVQITADKGKCYSFGKISFQGNKTFSAEDICSRFTITPGTAYNPEGIRETIRKIMDYYGRRGYIDATVDYETRLENKSRCFSVHFKIDEGKQYKVGLIKVFGNDLTQTRVILHEVSLTPGRIFNTDMLKISELRLQNIGFFKTVNVYAVKSEGPFGLGECYRDVHIEVEEGQTGNIGLSFGLSTSEGIVGGINWSESNFNIHGLTTFWKDGYYKLRGAGEYAYLTTQIGANSRNFVFSWTKPYVRDSNWAAGFDLSHKNNGYYSDDYTLHTSNLTLRGSYPLTSCLRFKTHYRITHSNTKVDNSDDTKTVKIGSELFQVKLNSDGNARLYSNDIELDNAVVDAKVHKEATKYWDNFVEYANAREDAMNEDLSVDTEKLEEQGFNSLQIQNFERYYEDEKNPPDIHSEEYRNKYIKAQKKPQLQRINSAQGNAELKSDANNRGITSAIGASLIWDRTNHPIEPDSGWKCVLQTEIAGVGGNHRFFSFATIGQYYFSLTEKCYMQYSCNFHFVLPFAGTNYANMPIDERLFLGGDTYVRGYRAYRIGPLYSGTDDPRGGLSLQFYSAECVYRLFDHTDAFLFCDAGSLSRTRFTWKEPRLSIGWGFNLKFIPNMPPITLGMGYPINRKNSSEQKKFFFALGGQY